MTEEQEQRKNANVMKVVELGLQDRVLDEIRKPTFNAQALEKQLRVEGFDISAHSIRKFIKATKEKQKEIIQSDIKQAREVVKLTMDYNKALKDILHEVEEIKNNVKDERDYVTYNQLVGRLLQGIELFAKLTGDIKPKGSVDIKIFYNEINSDIEKDMKDVRKSMFNEANVIDVDFEITQEDEKLKEDLER